MQVTQTFGSSSFWGEGSFSGSSFTGEGSFFGSSFGNSGGAWRCLEWNGEMK